MSRRYEQYKVERGANLGDPEFWNRRLEDIDVRLAAREADGLRIEEAAAEVQAAALARLDETFTPLVQEMLDQLANVGAAFRAVSESEHTIGTGTKLFLLVPEDRLRFVATPYVVARPIGSPGAGMIAAVSEYDRNSGLLVIDSLIEIGSGTFTSWEIVVSPPPDVGHETRTDNPHEVTKAQVGLGDVDDTSDADKPISTAAQTALDLKAPLASPALTGNPTAPTQTSGTSNTRIATTAFVQAAVAALVDTAPGALDTLNELAAALGDDANFAGTVTTALAAKLDKTGGTLTGALSLHADPSSAAHAATKRYVDSLGLPGYRGDLGVSNSVGDTTNDIVVSPGAVMDDTGTVLIRLTSSIVKRLDAAWAVGNNQGGRDAGSIANGTWHVSLIMRADTGVVDVMFTLSSTAPTMPANYTHRKWIFSIVRAGGAIRLFTHIPGHKLVIWKELTTDRSSTSAFAEGNLAVTVPATIEAMPIFYIGLLADEASGVGVYIRSGDATDSLVLVAYSLNENYVSVIVPAVFRASIGATVRYVAEIDFGTIAENRIMTIGYYYQS